MIRDISFRLGGYHFQKGFVDNPPPSLYSPLRVKELCLFYEFDYGLDGIFGLSQSFIGFIHSALSTNASWARGTGG